MRLFVAIDIAPEIRERLARFRSEMKPLAPAARWVGVETFHITLKFIGEQTPQQMESIRAALGAIHSAPTRISFRQTGFFPNPRAARVFWVGIEADSRLAELAQAVDRALVPLGVQPEDRPYTPHLTLARAGGSSPTLSLQNRERQGWGTRTESGNPRRMPGDRANTAFASVQQKLSVIHAPEFGTMTASEFFLYESRLSPAGAQYTKLARFALG